MWRWILLSGLALLLLAQNPAEANFLADPKCPPAVPLSPAQCKGRRSTCWSPGVRDLDCPGSGLCCYDGCANTCAASAVHASQSVADPIKVPQPRPTSLPAYVPPKPTPAPAPIHVPEETYGPPLPSAPLTAYVPPAPLQETYGPPIAPPQESYGPPVAQPQETYGPPVAVPQETYGPPVPAPAPLDTYVPPPPESYGPPEPQHSYPQPAVVAAPQPPAPAPFRPGISQPGKCPHVSPLSGAVCAGRYSTCWSVGVSDLDCPNLGLCCFDGCANTCLDDSTPRQPPTTPLPRYEPPTTPLPRYEPPRNPCDPNPCGERAMCIPQEGLPFCKCPEGLVPDPTPELRCSEPRDPCNPSPCGPGTSCAPNRDGNPICTCLPGLIPKPDTITGCGPECTIDPDCKYGYVCREQRCVEKPDPCQPSPCGPGTTCQPNRDGNPVCQCLPGLIPKPDTITGCGPECTVDPDCKYGFICREQKCIERPDPCDPNPCGPDAVCLVQGSGYSCECPNGFVGNGETGCFRGECTVDDECPLDKACSNYRCIDPCLTGTCSSTDFCRVMRHVPICGFNYDPPPQETRDEFVIGERYQPTGQPERRKQVVIGSQHEGVPDRGEPRRPVVIGGSGFPQVGASRCSGRTGCQSDILAMMAMMDTSRLPVIGASFERRRKRRASLRRYNLN